MKLVKVRFPLFTQSPASESERWAGAQPRLVLQYDLGRPGPCEPHFPRLGAWVDSSPPPQPCTALRPWDWLPLGRAPPPPGGPSRSSPPGLNPEMRLGGVDQAHRGCCDATGGHRQWMVLEAAVGRKSRPASRGERGGAGGCERRGGRRMRAAIAGTLPRGGGR